MGTFWYVFNGDLHVISLAAIRNVIFLTKPRMPGTGHSVDVFYTWPNRSASEFAPGP
jgi:hypothetical protein